MEKKSPAERTLKLWVKKIKIGNLLVEENNQKRHEKLIRMKTFHIFQWKVYSHEKLNTLKGVIRNRELSLWKQVITDYERIIIRKGGEEIQTHTYILISNKATIPKEMKIGYCLEKTEQYIPAHLRCYRCKKKKKIMDITCRAVKDVWHVEGVTRKVQTARGKIVLTKPNAQTAKRTILPIQELKIYTKERGKS